MPSWGVIFSLLSDFEYGVVGTISWMAFAYANANGLFCDNQSYVFC